MLGQNDLVVVNLDTLLIEDGCNEILSIKGGYQMMDPDLL